MPLFDVPGWDVAANPVTETPQSSKKRKRRSVDSNDTNSSKRMGSVDINFDKIMSKFKGAGHSENTNVERGPSSSKKETPRKRKAGKEKEKEKGKAKELRGKMISHPMRLQPTSAIQARKSLSESTHTLPPKKKAKLSPLVETLGSSSPVMVEDEHPEPVTPSRPSESSSTLTAMQKSMKQRLDGARFR